MGAVMNNTTEAIREILKEVYDPEVPVLSVLDLGVVRDIETTSAGKVIITVTPTYSGCPAMDMIRMQIRLALLQKGYQQIQIDTVLSPAWTTDWMTEAGRQKLKAYGVAPPHYQQQVCSTELFAEETVQCPRCNSYHTHLISRFGATACKSLYQCDDCLEPFDYFKCH